MKLKWWLDGERRRLGGYAVMFTLLMLIGVQGAWADGFGVLNNEVAITTDGGAYAATIGTDGIAAGVDAMLGNNLDTLALTVINDNLGDGTYTLNLGIVVDDADNDRRIEAYLPGVQVEVSGNKTNTAVTLQANQDLRIAGRSADGNTSFTTTMTNDTQDGPVTAVGNLLSFSFSSLQSKIEAKFGAAGGTADIINSFLKEGKFSYTILVNSVNAPMGHVVAGAVTPFTDYNIGSLCGQYGKNLAQLSDSPIANSAYLSGKSYAIRGSFGVGAGNAAPAAGEAPSYNGACGGGGGGTVTPPEEPGDGDPVTPGDLTDEPAADVAQSLAGDVPAEAADTFEELLDSAADDTEKQETLEKLADVLEELNKLEGGTEQAAAIIGEMAPEDAADIVGEMGVADAADVVEQMEVAKAADVVEQLEVAKAADVVEQMPMESASGVVDEMEPAQAADVMEDMHVDIAADIVETLAADQAADVVEQMDEAKAGVVLANAGAAEAGAVLLDIVTNRDTTDPAAVEKNTLLIAQTLSSALLPSTTDPQGDGVTSLESFLADPGFVQSLRGAGAAFVSIADTLTSGTGTFAEAVDSVKKRLDDILTEVLAPGGRRDARAEEDVVIVTDPETGRMDIQVQGLSFPASMTDIFVTGEPPAQDGVLVAGNGLGLTFAQTEGLGSVNLTVVPAVVDPAGLTALLGEDSTQIDIENGFLVVTGQAGEKYVGAFGWGAGNVSESSRTITGFDAVGTDPASAEYRLQLVYSDEARQDLAPAIMEVDKLAGLLTAFVENGDIDSFVFDRNSGVLYVVLGGQQLMFKPSYLVEPNAEEPVLDEFGVTLTSDGDENGDGLADLIMTTASGSQVLYTVPQ